MKQNPSWLAEQLGLFVARLEVGDDLLLTIRDGWSAWDSKDSTIYQGAETETLTDSRYRSSRRLYAPETETSMLVRSIEQQLPAISRHFSTPLTRIEEIQLLRYNSGDHFAKHRDGRLDETGSVPSKRRISIVALVSDPSEYVGGDFVVFPNGIDTHGRGFGIRPRAGELLAFPAELEHQVNIVESGTRLSVVTWAS